MIIEKLETTYNYMTEILRREQNPRLRRLCDDLFNYYYLVHGTMPDPCKRIWDTCINLRLRMITVQNKVTSEKFAAIKQMFSGYTTYPDIRFGQIRIGSTFQGGLNVNQQAILDMPNVNGLNVVQYGQQNLNHPNNSDLLPVAIFEHQGFWVAANNRGFTSHCAGGVKPLRLLPRLPEQAELNRLNDVEGQGAIPIFQYNHGVVHINRPHTVPSLQMPITTGPNTWTVEAVVNRPIAW